MSTVLYIIKFVFGKYESIMMTSNRICAIKMIGWVLVASRRPDIIITVKLRALCKAEGLLVG